MKQPNSGTLLKSYILQEVVPFFSVYKKAHQVHLGEKKASAKKKIHSRLPASEEMKMPPSQLC